MARWELSTATGAVDRRTVVVGVLAILLVGGVVGAAVLSGVGGVTPDGDIYRVAVDEDDPYAPVVESDDRLAVRPPDATLGVEADVHVESHVPSTDEGAADDIAVDGWVSVTAVETEKGAAAAQTLRAATESYNDRLMAAESNQSAAFPVDVTLRYEPRGGFEPAGDDPTDDSIDDPDDVATDHDALEGDEEPSDAEREGDDPTLPAGDADADDGGLAVPQLGGSGGLFGGSTAGSPAEITPPFPFSSLILAFLFLIPMNFLVQAYGSSILGERVNRRGELLLVAPVEPLSIVAGKTLPYLAGAIGVTALIALFVGGGIVSVLAIVPVALAFLAATFLGALFARSFKELTFVTVTVSVFFTTYVFVPAIFINVTPIALISPLSLVVLDLQGEAVGVGEYLFATGPLYLVSAVCFWLGAGVYREEDLFSQKPLPAKALDALAVRVSGPRSVALLTAVFIPFVFVAELLAVAVLFALPIAVSIPLLLVVIALIEEVAKSVHVYAGFVDDRLEVSVPSALAVGAASGIGFFLAEKGTVVVQLVGLPELSLGRAAFGPAGVAGTGQLPWTVLLALLLAPLGLHVVTAVISALGAHRNRRLYAVALAIATLVHAGYNFGVVTFYA
ncbi:PrsW family intramembrane metalloprotease [Halalkaliarchaeum sp. AArc-CO]|uniref:ABC transporter permease n=1 Tax=Halalkaliarchaeum sp. AArc-CO TaxID=2866381 RepID=UPI00217D4A88|nr:PrsW family intramembrane metalloprotease [Halalkaliarchaeum sp. AArc-CO]